jgi:alpha-L-arabinofuranosidase
MLTSTQKVHIPSRFYENRKIRRGSGLQADKPDDTNTIQEPKKIFPVIEQASGLGANFTRLFPPFSITVLELKAE